MPLKISEPSGTSQSICTRTFRNLTDYLHRNPPEPHRLSAPEPSGTSPGICIGTLHNLTRYCICTETLRNLTRYLHLNFLEPYRVPAPEPCATSPAICVETLWNLTRHLYLNFLEPYRVPAPEPCATSPAICVETLWNLTRYLHRNPPEPHQASAPEPSGTSTRYLHRNNTVSAPEQQVSASESSKTSPGIFTETLRNLTRYTCTGTLQNLTSYMPQNLPEPHHEICTGTLQNLRKYSICTGTLWNPPEPCTEPGVEAAPDRTRANLGQRPHSKVLLLGKNGTISLTALRISTECIAWRWGSSATNCGSLFPRRQTSSPFGLDLSNRSEVPCESKQSWLSSHSCAHWKTSKWHL